MYATQGHRRNWRHWQPGVVPNTRSGVENSRKKNFRSTHMESETISPGQLIIFKMKTYRCRFRVYNKPKLIITASDPGGGGGGGGGYSLYDGWYICATVLTPLFWSSGYQTRSFWGVFSHPPTQKRSFGYKSSLNSIFLAPKYHFPLDLFGSNFQWPTAHPQQFSDRVPPPRPTNERRRYNVTSPLIGWKHTQNDPCWVVSKIEPRIYAERHLTCLSVNPLRSERGRNKMADILQATFSNALS